MGGGVGGRGGAVGTATSSTSPEVMKRVEVKVGKGVLRVGDRVVPGKKQPGARMRQLLRVVVGAEQHNYLQ